MGWEGRTDPSWHSLLLNYLILYAVLTGAAICVHSVIQGVAVGGARKKVFGPDSSFRKTEEYKKLNEEHNKITKSDIDKNGYPDMGQGKNSCK